MSEKITIFHQLKKIYEGIVQLDEESLEEILELLNQINFKGITDYYISISGEKEFDDMDLLTCKKIVEILQYVYNNTSLTSPLSDDDYDKLYQVILDNGISDIVGSVNSQGKPVKEHKYIKLRGTLNKVHHMFNLDKNGDKRRSVEDWINTISSIINEPITNNDVFRVRLLVKWDGVSVVFENDKNGFIKHALLRGDTDKNIAVDVTALFKDVVNFTEYADGEREFGLKTEVLMNVESYNNICKDYKVFTSPRSATTSIVNEKVLQPDLVKYLTIEPLRIQYDGDEPRLVESEYDRTSNLYNMREIEFLISEMNERVREEGLSTDGVVLYLEDQWIQKKLGRDGAINRFEVAYKFPAESKKSILLDVDFSIGLGGTITPVAKIEPIIIKGKQISSISLGSVDRFESLDLRKGSEVIIKYEIIPYLEVDASCKINEHGYKFQVPTHCKYCSCKLELDPVLKCINEDCSSRIVGNVVNYINKMRIENVNIETIATFFDEGIVNGIESLYSLEDHKNHILSLPGFGLKSFNKIVDGINAKKDVYDYEMMGALGIPNIGNRIFKKVLSIMDLNTLLNLSKEHMLMLRLIGMPGFGEKTVSKIQRGINSKLKTIYFLLDTLTIKENSNTVKSKGKICFTKVRNIDFENELVSKGYEVTESFNKEVNILIVPSLATNSNKIDKAEKYGIKIMTLDDAIREL